MTELPRQKTVITVTAAALIASLTVGSGIALADREPDQAPSVQEKSAPVVARMPDGRLVNELTKEWPVNEHGLTYGYPTTADVDTPGAVVPDLVTVRDDERKDGYVYYDHKFAVLYDPPRPGDLGGKTGRRLDERGEIVIDVFAADGKTVTGVYSLTHPQDDEVW